MNTLQICPPHLSDVATLPWEIQKVIFHHYYLYTSNYLLYLEENKLQSSLVPFLLSEAKFHTFSLLLMSATLPWEMQKVIFHHYYLYTPNCLLYLEENKL